MIDVAHEVIVLILVTRTVCVTTLTALLSVGFAENTDEDAVEDGLGIAPMLLMKTAESRRRSCRSQIIKDSACEPGVVVWLI